MILRKEGIDNGWLGRLDESLIEDLLTDAYSAEEIIENIRALGGDPEQTGERGRALGAQVLASTRFRRAIQSASAHQEVSNRQINSAASEKHGQWRRPLLANPSNGSGSGFRAFGKSYSTEREAVMKFLEAVARPQITDAFADLWTGALRNRTAKFR